MTTPDHVEPNDLNRPPTAAEISALAAAVEQLRVQFQRSRKRLITLVSVLALIIGGVGYAVIEVRHALGCLNGVLADRAGPTKNDNAAILLVFSAMDDLVTTPPGQAAHEYQKVFKPDIATATRILRTDQATRDSQPLGQC